MRLTTDRGFRTLSIRVTCEYHLPFDFPTPSYLADKVLVPVCILCGWRGWYITLRLELTISLGTSVLVNKVTSSPSAADGSEDFRSSSSSRREGTRLVVFFGAAATSIRAFIDRTRVSSQEEQKSYSSGSWGYRTHHTRYCVLVSAAGLIKETKTIWRGMVLFGWYY